MYVFLIYNSCLKSILYGAIATTSVDKVPLFRSCAHTSTIAAESCTTALWLALIILEKKQVIGTNLYGRAT